VSEVVAQSSSVSGELLPTAADLCRRTGLSVRSISRSKVLLPTQQKKQFNSASVSILAVREKQSNVLKSVNNHHSKGCTIVHPAYENTYSHSNQSSHGQICTHKSPGVANGAPLNSQKWTNMHTYYSGDLTTYEFTKKSLSLLGIHNLTNPPTQTKPLLKKEEQTQDPILEHMLANPLGCSSEKVKAYRAQRGHRISIKTWDSAVKIYLEICFKQPTSISPDEGLDALLKRTDGSTSFDIVFPDARQSANIRSFEKEAAEHDLARGQDIDSLIAEFKRIGIKHNLSQDFDYQGYYAERGKKEAAARNAENMLTSNAHNNPSSGNSDSNQSSMESAALNGSAEKTYESYSEEDIKDEPAYRQQIIRAQRASTANPPVSIESNKTAPRIDSEMTMDDSKAISVELMEDPFTSTTGICEEPIANAVCDLPLHSNDFSAEGVAIIGATALLFTKCLSKKSVKEHVNISSAKDLFGGFGKPAIHYTGKIINF